MNTKLKTWPDIEGYYWVKDNMGMFLAQAELDPILQNIVVHILGGVDDASTFTEGDLRHCKFYFIGVEFPED